MTAIAVGAVVAAFLAGSIPFGVLLARARGVDLRKIGSGNIGATNAARALGKRLGVVVLLCDAAKGFGPTLAARTWLAPRIDDGAIWVAAVGFAAFVGHLAPPWLRFRGGKGVATALGVFFALAPGPTFIAVAVFALTYALTRISSLGSLAGSTAFLPAIWWSGADRAYAIVACAMWALILLKHRGNIARLARHEEKKI